MNVFQILKALIMLCICAGLVACTNEDPNPELKDPIYKDLLSRHDKHKKAIEEGKKQLAELQKTLSGTEAHSLEMRNTRSDIENANAAMLQDVQWERYFRIRAERRRVEGRAAYREAHTKGEAWPKPSEYSDYLMNIRLREAQMNWNARVPKLQDRIKAARKSASVEPGAEGKPAEAKEPATSSENKGE